MKTCIVLFLTGFIFLSPGCKASKEKSSILFVPEEKNLFHLEVSDDVKVGIAPGNDNKQSLKFQCGGLNPAPYVIIHDRSKSWKLSDYHYLTANVFNPGPSEIMVEIRLDANGWGSQGTMIPPGGARTLRTNIPQRIPEYYARKIIGMYNLPGGILKSDRVADSIHKISFLVSCPPKNAILIISDIQGEGEVTFPAKAEMDGDFFPLLDEFGQYRHADWPLKIHGLAEMKASVEEEKADLEAHPRPAEWDQFGGWLNGPRLEATGHFRTEKVNGKWWLVDPEGYLFWSHGMGSVAIGGGSAIITDREFYFTDLPDSVQYSEFYRTRRSAPFGYYRDKVMKSFDFIAWNMMQKYGEDWKEQGIELAARRLGGWGQNTFGAWTSPEVFLPGKVPYAPIIMIGSKRLEGSTGHWYKFIDPFDASMVGNLTRKIKAIEKSTTDPYCIGYFVDNEFTWGDSASMANWTLASPPDQSAKIAMQAFLKEKYQDIQALNQYWGSDYGSWDDFLTTTGSVNYVNDDTREFTRLFIVKYFENVLGTIRTLAPGKLYLGPRLDYHFYPSEKNLNPWDSRNNWIVNLAAQYCDVVSFNRYRASACDLRPGDFDKPVIVGEWHHTPLEKSSFYMSPDHFNESLAMRAEKYEWFINSCINNKYIVGAHYFQYLDQPTVGRGDGENFSCGFLTICDRPYTEMIDISRETGRRMYQMRYSGK